jgi:HEAT repeat protein
LDPRNNKETWELLLRSQIAGQEKKLDALIGRSFAHNSTISGKDGMDLADACAVIDWHLKRLPGHDLQGLRELQEKKCRRDIGQDSLAERSPSELLALFRRYPWSATAQQGLMILASKELERGRGQAPRRLFQDIFAHSVDAELRARAQVGMWIAISRGDDPNELAAAFADVKSDDRFPWMGGEATAGDIRELLQGVERENARRPRSNAQRPRSNAQHPSSDPLKRGTGHLTLPPALSSLRHQVVKLPLARLWPIAKDGYEESIGRLSIQFSGTNILLSSSDSMCWYDGHDTGSPLRTWTQIFHADSTKSRKEGTGGKDSGGVWRKDKPGRLRPSIVGRNIYTGCGYGHWPTYMVCLDANSGAFRWGREAGEARIWGIPVVGPKILEGQIFTHSLATERVNHVWTKDRLGFSTSLVCMDAETGSVIWRRSLPQRTDARCRILCNGVSVHNGAVYSPAPGMVAKCDIRDGRIEWVHNYKSAGPPWGPEDPWDPMDPWGPGGSAPIVADKLVICHTRDAKSVIGLDAETGALVWQNAQINPTRVLGQCGEKVIVLGEYFLAAMDIHDGQVLWIAPIAEPAVGRPQVIGTDLFLGTSSGLRHIDMNSGNEREFMPWPESADPVRNFAIHAGMLYLVPGQRRDKPSSPISKTWIVNATAETVKGSHLAAVDVQRSVQQLSSEDWIMQAGALERLGRHKVEAAAPQIERLLKEGQSSWVKGRALVALSRIRGADLYAGVEQSSRDKDAVLRRAALEALDIIGTEEAFAVVRKLLKDEEPSVRAEAAHLCARSHPEEAWLVVKALTDNPAPQLTATTAHTLAFLGTDEALARLEEMYDAVSGSEKRQYQVIEGLLHADKRAIPLVVRLVARHKPEGRAHSLGQSILKSFNAEDVSLHLQSVFTSGKSDLFRTAVFFATTVCPSGQMADAISASLKKDDSLPPETVYPCLQAIVTLGAERHTALFTDFLGHEDDRIRALAVRCRSLYDRADLFEVFRPLIIDKNAAVAVTALKSLALMPDDVAPREGTVDYLRALIHDDNPIIRLAAFKLLASRRAPSEFNKALDLLKPYLEGEDVECRLRAAESLAQLGGEENIAAVAAAQGYIGKWRILGSFSNDKGNSGFAKAYPPEKEVDFDKKYSVKIVWDMEILPRGEKPEAKLLDIGWQETSVTEASGKLNVAMLMPPPAHFGIAYGVADIESPSEQVAQAYIEADNSYKLWVNDKKVSEKVNALANLSASTTVPVPSTRIPLKQGKNRFLIKVANTGGPWWFRVRLLDEKGKVFVAEK